LGGRPARTLSAKNLSLFEVSVLQEAFSQAQQHKPKSWRLIPHGADKKKRTHDGIGAAIPGSQNHFATGLIAPVALQISVA
jgi:hypothetical protein